MNPTTKRRLRRLVMIFVIIISALGVWVLCSIGCVYYIEPDLNGLIPLGTTRFPKSLGKEYEGSEAAHIEKMAHMEEWAHSAGKTSREVYRFLYEPNFHNYVCVSAWQDGDRYRIRSSVFITSLPTRGLLSRFSIWERTRALPAEQWEQIRAMFVKPSVIDPLHGKETNESDEVLILDGSTWTLEAAVDGHTRRVRIRCPVDTSLQNGIGPVKAESGFEEFVAAGQRMLEYGRVKVPAVY